MSVIYGLREIGTTEIRYVGLTNHSVKKRFREHQAKARGKWHYAPAPWMRSAGPVEAVILRICPASEARAAERRWIEKLFSEGHRLCNVKMLPSTPGRIAA